MVKAVETFLKIWDAKTLKNCVANHEGGVTDKNQTNQNPNPAKLQAQISDTSLNPVANTGTFFEGGGWVQQIQQGFWRQL